MLYYGLTTKKRVLVRNDIVGSMTIVPMAGDGATACCYPAGSDRAVAATRTASAARGPPGELHRVELADVRGWIHVDEPARAAARARDIDQPGGGIHEPRRPDARKHSSLPAASTNASMRSSAPAATGSSNQTRANSRVLASPHAQGQGHRRHRSEPRHRRGDRPRVRRRRCTRRARVAQASGSRSRRELARGARARLACHTGKADEVDAMMAGGREAGARRRLGQQRGDQPVLRPDDRYAGCRDRQDLRGQRPRLPLRARALVKHARARGGGGSIVNLASVAGSARRRCRASTARPRPP